MKIKKLSVLLFATLLAFSVISCANESGGENSGETIEQTQSGTITISADESSATVGDIVSISVAFANFESEPASVDVYVKESNSAVRTGVAISDGKITLDTSYFEAGTYNLYVVSGNVSSNSLEVSLKANSLSAPSDVKIELSSEKANTVDVTWTAPSDTSGITYYWIYYSTTNDTTQLSNPNATAYASLYVTDGAGKYSIALSESGTYYFWIKSADGISTYSATKISAFSKVASYEFTHSALTTPTNVSVTSNRTNTVTVSWTASNANYYWIYYSTTNDTTQLSNPNATAYASLYVTEGTGKYDITLSESGTYYFWVKAADGGNYSSTTGSSAFSEAASYNFIYTKLSAPTGLTVISAYDNTVEVSWNDNNSSYYWVYYNTSNTTETATCATRYISGYSYWYITLNETGTYYFWVKAADTSTSTSPTSDFSTAATYTYSN